MEKEIWKDIPDYEGYQVSDLGNVKSLKLGKNIILKPKLDRGYYAVNVHKNGIKKTFRIYILVAITFLGHKPCGYKIVVDHIDHNKLNDNLLNLRLISQRENTNRKHLKSSSKFTGVSWSKQSNKWVASISINGKTKSLGYFVDEIESSKAYQKALKELVLIHVPPLV